MLPKLQLLKLCLRVYRYGVRQSICMTTNLPQRLFPASLSGIGTFVVATTFGIGLLAYPVVPNEFTIRWTIGPDAAYYGPETVSKTVGLFLIPAVATVTYGILRLFPSVGGIPDAFGCSQNYRLTVVTVSVVFFLTQVLLVLFNMGFGS